ASSPYRPSSFSKYTPPTHTYSLSLHDALPIFESLPQSLPRGHPRRPARNGRGGHRRAPGLRQDADDGAEPVPDAVHDRCRRSRRSEEHTSELQSLTNLVCRLLLENKKRKRRLA